MVDETIDRSHCHRGVGKNGIPSAERMIGRHQETSQFVAMSNQFKKH